eukprot:1177482-Prorocentrum_minimum.AAC.1
MLHTGHDRTARIPNRLRCAHTARASFRACPEWDARLAHSSGPADPRGLTRPDPQTRGGSLVWTFGPHGGDEQQLPADGRLTGDSDPRSLRGLPLRRGRNPRQVGLVLWFDPCQVGLVRSWPGGFGSILARWVWFAARVTAPAIHGSSASHQLSRSSASATRGTVWGRKRRIRTEKIKRNINESINDYIGRSKGEQQRH